MAAFAPMYRQGLASLAFAALTSSSCASGTVQVPTSESSALSLLPGENVERREAGDRTDDALQIKEAAPAARSSSPTPTLDAFFSKGAALASKTRSEPLRLGVFGDSHIQADFWTGTLRQSLQRRLGDAGLGFVHIGWSGYRHEGVRLRRSGPLRTEPQPMTSGERKGDGVYGLSGVRVVIEEEGQASMHLVDEPARELRFDLAYRLPSCPSRARLVIEEGPKRARKAEARLLVCTEADDAGPIEHLEILTTGEAPSLSVEVEEGEIEVFGAVVEAMTPGVVVDALGIGGARADTPLAWDPEAFALEVERRAYDLVVLAYGTNDSVPESPAAVPAFGRHLTMLLARLRQGAPNADCLVIGPMDRGPLKRKKTAPEERIVELNEEAARVAEAERCAFFSAQDAMGGPGAIHDWASLSPPLAQKDLVHLSRAGYERMGELLSEVLLAPGGS